MMNERKALLKWFVVQVLYNVRMEECGFDRSCGSWEIEDGIVIDSDVLCVNNSILTSLTGTDRRPVQWK